VTDRPPCVVVAEPHGPTAAALRALLAHDADLDVTVLSDLPESGALARRLHAAVVVADGGLLRRTPTGLGVLPADTTLVVLATGDEVAFEQLALRRGAAAYLRKEQAADRLPALLHELVVRDGASRASAR
jgi:hypothetical protein